MVPGTGQTYTTRQGGACLAERKSASLSDIHERLRWAKSRIDLIGVQGRLKNYQIFNTYRIGDFFTPKVIPVSCLRRSGKLRRLFPYFIDTARKIPRIPPAAHDFFYRRGGVQVDMIDFLLKDTSAVFVFLFSAGDTPGDCGLYGEEEVHGFSVGGGGKGRQYCENLWYAS